MIKRPKFHARRRGQGTTEYIVLVGLIAILLVGAVLKFSNQIRITFIGTSGDVDGITQDMGTGVTPTNPDGGPVKPKTPTDPEDPPATPPGGN